jgi:hypothetical protein
MTQEEIVKGNKLISEFMGYRINFQDDIPFVTLDKILFDEYVAVSNWAKYNSSWDWLMPVVERIESFGYYFFMFPNNESHISKYTSIVGKSISQIQLTSKLESVWYVVVEFIKWYNKEFKK